MSSRNWHTLVLYAALFAVAAFALNWFEYGHLTGKFGTDAYIAFLALAFISLGVWVGNRLTRKAAPQGFERNHAALRSLKISDRELEVLEAIASGKTNKEIARALDISPNTIKTHVASLFSKLEVDRRMRAIEKAKSLQLIA
ncbi:response regulator transcription factor [Pontixanthobacter aestiaquae]|uniref:Helix-turn-helix transcriptional regulator n=1 Tax=Pontixanthobacter aestiaquae TaxID=1509367 RepID=A0A844Z188_9SPHN|nr:response regulator transcription factor [Pontixanthobacter aestiaquae]MDN3646521.1 response regulator transcription factor [Pontixanthobacter aestiaquae]MXO82491.1 helix-turn-helix transcriptional regulator [Pontixanthobacter aestiaquae]